MPLLGKQSREVLPPIKNPVFSLTEKSTVTVTENEDPLASVTFQQTENKKSQRSTGLGRLVKVFRTSSQSSSPEKTEKSKEELRKEDLSTRSQLQPKLLQPASNPHVKSTVIVSDSASRKKERLSLGSAQEQLIGDRSRSPAVKPTQNHAEHLTRTETLSTNVDESRGLSPASRGSSLSANVDDSRGVSPASRGSSPRVHKYHNVEELSEVMMVARATGDYQEVQRFLIGTFESIDEINSCFKVKDKPLKDYNDTGINFEFVDYVYASVLHLPKDVQKINLRSIINCLLKDTKRKRNEDDVRALLILLMNPQFTSSSTYVIFAHLLRQISVLGDNEQRQLMGWLRGIPLKEFKSIITRIQQFISCRLFPSAKDELPPTEKCVWWISTAAKVLALLNASNWYAHPPIVPHTFFYCNVLDHLELIKEYETWQQQRGKFWFCQYPFLLSLAAKRFMMQKDSEMKMIVEARESIVQHVKRREMLSMGMLFLNLKVRRSHLVSDSLNEIALKKQDLKKKLRVTFTGEPGLDMGGLTKEWFLLLIRKIFREEYGMFTYNSKIRTWWFNSASTDTLQEFNLLGVLMGLAVYNSINLDIRLPSCCYKKLLSPAVVPFHNPSAQVGIANLGLNDLEEVNPELAHGLKELLQYSGDVEDDLCQTFQVSYTSYGHVVTHDLKPNGSKMPVTNANREEYVRLYVDFLLNRSIYKQFYSFYHGFHSVCASNALILLRPEEVEMLVCGNPNIDIEALKKVTTYDGYSRSDVTIRYFWEVVLNFNLSLKKKMLLFTTGSDRIPVGGMSEMQFKITRMQGANVAAMLPMAHTCFNQLVLPPYKSKKMLKQKLTIAISNSEGFGIE